jgi:hypothetical protein
VADRGLAFRAILYHPQEELIFEEVAFQVLVIKIRRHIDDRAHRIHPHLRFLAHGFRFGEKLAAWRHVVPLHVKMQRSGCYPASSLSMSLLQPAVSACVLVVVSKAERSRGTWLRSRLTFR